MKTEGISQATELTIRTVIKGLARWSVIFHTILRYKIRNMFCMIEDKMTME